MRASVVRPQGGVRLLLFLALALGALASSRAMAQDEPLQALASPGVEGQILTLIPAAPGATTARVELPGGQTVAAALPRAPRSPPSPPSTAAG